MRVIYWVYIAFFQLIAFIIEFFGRRYEPIKQILASNVFYDLAWTFFWYLLFLVVSYAIRGYFTSFLEKRRGLRSLISDLAKFEGVWASRTDRSSRPYQISIMRYNKKSGNTNYIGRAYNEALQMEAKWNDNIVVYDEPSRSIVFFGEGEVGTEHDTRRRGTGSVVGRLRHSADSVDFFVGDAVDVGGWVSGERDSFRIIELRRMSEDVVEEIINKPWPTNDAEYKLLLKGALDKGIIKKVSTNGEQMSA